MNDEKIAKAKQLLDEWIANEKEIDQMRDEVITDLRKKINEIMRERMTVRAKIEDSIKLFERWKQTAG